MARKSEFMPMGGGGGGLGRRVVAVVIGLVLLSLVIRDPLGSAQTVAGAFEWAGHMIDAFTTFGHALSGRS